MRICPAFPALILMLVAVVSCSTPPVVVAPVPAPAASITLPPPPPGNPVTVSASDRQLGGCNAVYLAKAEMRHGFRHYIVTEVWRHDDAMGPAPRPGDDAVTPLSRSSDDLDDDGVLVGFRASGQSIVESTVPVAFIRKCDGGVSLEEVKVRVLSMRPEHRIWPTTPAGRADRMAHAAAVYLVKAEPGDQAVAVVITEVWRHAVFLGPPPIPGAELASPAQGARGMYHHGGLAVAVIFDGDRPGSEEAAPQPILLRILRDKVVDLGVSTDELRRLYAGHPRPEDIAAGFADLTLAPSPLERFDQAEAIYLVDVVREGPEPTFRIAEVMRHNERLGPAPAVGSELPRSRSTDAVARSVQVSQVLLLLRRGASLAALANVETASVMDGYVPIYRLSLDRLRERVHPTE